MGTGFLPHEAWYSIEEMVEIRENYNVERNWRPWILGLVTKENEYYSILIFQFRKTCKVGGCKKIQAKKNEDFIMSWLNLAKTRSVDTIIHEHADDSSGSRIRRKENRQSRYKREECWC